MSGSGYPVSGFVTLRELWGCIYSSISFFCRFSRGSCLKSKKWPCPNYLNGQKTLCSDVFFSACRSRCLQRREAAIASERHSVCPKARRKTTGIFRYLPFFLHLHSFYFVMIKVTELEKGCGAGKAGRQACRNAKRHLAWCKEPGAMV